MNLSWEASKLCVFSSFLIIIPLASLSAQAADSLLRGESIKDGQTLVSARENFVLGFFSPGNSSRRYVGIWYSNVPTKNVVWVANREQPISDSSGVFSLGDDGNLVVTNSGSKILWSSNSSIPSNSSSAILLDTGNLVLQDKISGQVLWQSFDYPTDSFLPGMRLGFDNGKRKFFSSWKSPDDPAPGNFILGVDAQVAGGQVVLWEGSRRFWRSGQWNGETFAGVANKRPIYLFGFQLSYNSQDGDRYFSFTLFNDSDIVKYVPRWDGMLEQFKWEPGLQKWTLSWHAPADACEQYGQCGDYGSCQISNSPICSCLRGFEPKSAEEWSRGVWKNGCFRRVPLKCDINGSSTGPREEDGFYMLDRVKLPDLGDWVASAENDGECKQMCLTNCSCTGYAYPAGIGCLLWGRNLVDVMRYADGGNQLYIRLAASELGEGKKFPIVIAVPVVLVGLTLIAVTYIFWRYRGKLKLPRKISVEKEIHASLGILVHSTKLGDRRGKGPELPMFDYSTVSLATNHFCDSNKLGQGGFGSVYKGTLYGGQEVAVKRLSSGSGQGLEEFKNEVVLFAKLQHRNLVRLLGCCIHGEEKMLIYEFMPNKSLDAVLFDRSKRMELDWSKRFNIIQGITRGLLYLHRDSRLRIIHRDLKAANILLDEDMNAKISDFGLARIFGGNQDQAATRRVVGTYGYMSPEYAMEGLFSTKSDVYSFGVLLFEIVTGTKNSGFYDEHESLHLLGHAWKLWREERVVELVDPLIRDSCSEAEVLRCVHLGLLCVQDLPSERPHMSYVALMLESETPIQFVPEQPKFTITRSSKGIVFSDHSPESASANNVTYTLPVGR